MTEDRGQKADKRGQKTELRCQRWGIEHGAWGIEHGAWGIEKRKLGSWEVRKRGGSRRKTEGFEFGMIEHGAGSIGYRTDVRCRVSGGVDLEFGMGNLERSSEKLGSQEVEGSKEKFTAQDAKNTERFEAESKAHRAKRSRSWEVGKVGDRRTEGSGLQRR